MKKVPLPLGIKLEMQACACFAVIFFVGLNFRLMYRGLGFVSYDEYRVGFLLWGFIWFGTILCSILHMHNKAKKAGLAKYVRVFRYTAVLFVLLTALLIKLRYFENTPRTMDSILVSAQIHPVAQRIEGLLLHQQLALQVVHNKSRRYAVYIFISLHDFTRNIKGGRKSAVKKTVLF